MFDHFNLPDETKEKIYDDGFHPVVSETGKLLGRIPQLINAALAPLDCWIAEREYHVEKTKRLLEQNLKNVSPEKIVPPEPYVAVPALQAISYAMNSDELRTLYANLLAKSIYSDTKDCVHPAFTEIIKTLSPLDCKVFEFIMKNRYEEIAFYELRVGPLGRSEYHVAFPYVTAINLSDITKIAASINNLSRNLLIATHDFHFTDDSYYEEIRNTNFYKAISDAYQSHPNNKELRPYKKSIKSTDFGRDFYRICCTPL